MKIQILLKKKKPFAVIQYFEWLRKREYETIKVFEVLTIDKESSNCLGIYKLNKDNYDFFNLNKHLLKLICKTKDGVVYEFMNFKNELEKAREQKLKLKHKS